MSNLLYPLNLDSDEFGGNRVVYHIYVPSSSTYGSASESPNKLGSVSQDDRGIIAGQNFNDKISSGLSNIGSGISKVSTAGGNAASNMTPAAVSGGFQTLTKGISQSEFIKSISGPASETFNSYVSGFSTVFSQFNQPNTIKSADQTIQMYMPAAIESNYNAGWTSKDLGNWAAGIDAIQATANVGETEFKAGAAAAGVGGVLAMALGGAAGISNYLPSILALFATGSITSAAGQQAAAGLAANAAFKADGLTGFGGFLSKITGLAGNPITEQLFTNMEFREFSHYYDFYPRSKAEAERAVEIIKAFKLHMHPEYKVDPYLFLYPSEFKIEYITNNESSKVLPRLKNCALKRMDVTYGDRNHYAPLANGYPAHIELKLDFIELAILTKKDINEGGM